MQHTISEIDYALDADSDQTSSAFLVTALRWMNQHGVWQAFTRLLAVDMKTVTYSPLQKLQTIIASLVIGCTYMKDINSRLVPDLVAATLLGCARFPDQSQCHLLLRRFTDTNLGELAAIHAEHLQHFERFPDAHWQGYLLVDIDQCGLVAGGKTYHLARKGYFGRQRGTAGYQLSVAWLGQQPLVLGLCLDPGNVPGTTRLRELVETSAARVGEAYRQVLYRVDGGYGTQPQIRWFLATGRRFLAKGAIRRADKWAARVAPDGWQSVPRAPGVRVAEVAAGPGVRGIVCEVTTPKGEVQYSVVLTNLPAAVDAVTLWHLYGGRQTIEAFFKLGRHVYGLGNLRSRDFTAIAAFLWVIAITHNLLQWLKRDLFGGTPLEKVGTRELVETVGRIPARRERTEHGWRLYLPAHLALARLFVQILCPHWVQLALHL
jgi:hypothetical protein